MTTPAKADAAAILPVFLMNSRRELRESWVWFIGDIFLTLPDGCQFKKSIRISFVQTKSPYRVSRKGHSCAQMDLELVDEVQSQREGVAFVGRSFAVRIVAAHV